MNFASACSGHGYKFASVIGEILADLAERQQSRHTISLFALSRFGGPLSKLHRRKVDLLEHGLPGDDRHAGRRGGARPLTVHDGPLSMVSGGRTDTTDAQYWRGANVTPFW